MKIYLDYYWNIWDDAIENLKKYTLYITNNIFQNRKCYFNIKIDKNLQNAAKNYVIDRKIFDGKDINLNNKEKNIEKKDEKDIDLSMADIYLYTVNIIHMW